MGENEDLEARMREESDWLSSRSRYYEEIEKKRKEKERLEREKKYLGTEIKIPERHNFREHKETYPEIYQDKTMLKEIGKRDSDNKKIEETIIQIEPLTYRKKTNEILKQFVDIRKHNRKFSTTITKRGPVGGRSGRGRRITVTSNYLEGSYKGEIYLKEVLSKDNTKDRINEFEALKIIYREKVKPEPKNKYYFCRYMGIELASRNITNITKELKEDLIDMNNIIRGNNYTRIDWPDLGELKGMISNPQYVYLNRLVDYTKLNKGKPLKEIIETFFKEQELYHTIFDSNNGILKEMIHYTAQRKKTLQRQLNQNPTSSQKEKLDKYTVIEQRYKKMLSSIEVVQHGEILVDRFIVGKDNKASIPKQYISRQSIDQVVFEYNKYFLDDLFDDTGACLSFKGTQKLGSICYLLDNTMHITHINEYNNEHYETITSILKNISFVGTDENKERVLVVDGSILSEKYEYVEETYFSLNYKGLLKLAQKVGVNKVLVNTSHSRAQQSTHNFVKYVADQNGLKEGQDYIMEKDDEINTFKLISGLKSGKNGFNYTHHVAKKPLDTEIVRAVSNGQYKGEQFLDSFYLWEKYHNPSNQAPQWNIGRGYMTAIEVNVPAVNSI